MPCRRLRRRPQACGQRTPDDCRDHTKMACPVPRVRFGMSHSRRWHRVSDSELASPYLWSSGPGSCHGWAEEPVLVESQLGLAGRRLPQLVSAFKERLGVGGSMRHLVAFPLDEGGSVLVEVDEPPGGPVMRGIGKDHAALVEKADKTFED